MTERLSHDLARTFGYQLDAQLSKYEHYSQHPQEVHFLWPELEPATMLEGLRQGIIERCQTLTAGGFSHYMQGVVNGRLEAIEIQRAIEEERFYRFGGDDQC